MELVALRFYGFSLVSVPMRPVWEAFYFILLHSFCVRSLPWWRLGVAG